MINLEPQYINFYLSLLISIRNRSTIILVYCFLVITFQAHFKFALIFSPMLLIVLFIAFNENVYCLKRITIINNKLEMVVNKYNNEYKKYSIDIINADIRIEPNLNWMEGKKFTMRIYDGKQILCKQIENRNWTKENFIDIYTSIKTNQGKPVYLNFMA